MERPAGTGGILLPLPPRLEDLTRAVAVKDILHGTAFQANDAHELLDCVSRVDWHRTPGFVWYNWSANTMEPFSEDLSPTAVAVGEVSTPPSPLFAIA